jgi:hypothetical protein
VASSSFDLELGELVVVGLLGFAALEVIAGIGKGIEQSAANTVTSTTTAATAGVKGFFDAVKQGFEGVGETIAADYEALFHDSTSQDLLNPEQGNPGGTGTQTGPAPVGNSGTANSTQVGTQ